MPNAPHKNPHYALRIEETTMDKLKYIAGHNGRYDFIRKRTNR